jgi:sec-independent protein translocase protein TatC
MRSESDMSILDHLEDLRKAILRSCASLLMGMVAAFFFTRDILFFLTQPLRRLGVDPETFLVVPQVMGGFKVALSVIFWSGLLIASPFIVFFIAQFVFPGLHVNEKKVIRRFSWTSVLLFFGGASLGYLATVEVALENLLFVINDWMGTSTDWIFLTDYIAFVLKLVIGFGLAFQLPLVVLILGFADLISASGLRKNRRQVLVGLLVMAMLLTPPEPVSQLIMAGTLYILYEGCILLIHLHERKSRV